MTLTSSQILSSSFVVTINEDRYNAFVSEFEAAKIPILPKKFIGYEIEDSYLISAFKIVSDLQYSEKRGILEYNLRKFHAICNNASHFAIVQHAMLLDFPFVTIFEDDAVPTEDCLEKLDLYCSNVPDDTDVLRLGWFLSSRERMNQAPLPEPVFDHFIVKRFPGSHAYVVFKKFYKRFLESNKHQPRCDLDKINPSPDKTVYALKEPLFVQQNILNAPVMHAYRMKDRVVKLPPVH